MEIVATMVGGVLALLGSLTAFRVQRSHHREDTRRDEQNTAYVDAASAFHHVTRQFTPLAYTHARTAEAKDLEILARDAIADWNACVAAVALVGTVPVVEGLLLADAELEQLFAAASSKQWSKEGWRERRFECGRLMATFLNLARAERGNDRLESMTTIWGYRAWTTELARRDRTEDLTSRQDNAT